MIDALNPAAMLFRIDGRMSSGLKLHVSPEDIWQETLLSAWRDREHLSWRGLPGFRQWLMEIAENRIRDAVERYSAAKRGAAAEQPLVRGDETNRPRAEVESALPSRERTPPSVAMHAERAKILREALDGLPDHYREVLRLRLFEEWDRDRIADHLGLSIPAVKHRIRLGAALYRERLASLLSSRGSVAAAGPGSDGKSDGPGTKPSDLRDARDD